MPDKDPRNDLAVEGATSDAGHPARGFMVSIPVVLWIWLCRDWPTRLGFYSDDWMVLLHPFAGSADAFSDILRLVATRPVSAPYIWLAQVIVDWSPVRSQLLNATMLLVGATSVGLLAATLISAVHGLREGKLIGAAVAAATFIVFPSTIGTYAWGTGVSTAMPALPLFCVATSILVHYQRSWWGLVAGLALALLSHLSYEAFYFQEITIVLLAATLRGNSIRDIPWRVMAGAILVNAACIAFNRWSSGGVQKSFHPDFLNIFIGGYSHILGVLGHAIREHKFLIAATVLVAGPLGAVCLARSVGAGRTGLALLMMICGVVAAGLLYALAGYGLVAEGPLARLCIVLATFYSLAAGMLAAAARSMAERLRLVAAIFWISVAVGLTTLGLTARARVDEWADTWSQEVTRLSRLPSAITSLRMYPADDQRVYVAIEDRLPSTVELAMAPWEIQGAVAWAAHETTGSRLLTAGSWKQATTRWFATPPGWFNRWDGRIFEQGFCSSGTVIYSAAAPELWSWTSSSGEFGKVEAPWKHGCH